MLCYVQGIPSLISTLILFQLINVFLASAFLLLLWLFLLLHILLIKFLQSCQYLVFNEENKKYYVLYF